jgi:hypothetical protein
MSDEATRNEVFLESARGLLCSGRWERFIRGLRKRDFAVLVGMTSVNGIPTDVLVGVSCGRMPLDTNVKDVFYRFTSRHNLPFSSGEAYIEKE